MKGRIKKIEAISKKFHNVFRFTKRTAEIETEDGKKHVFDRHVLETGPAVSVLPYFFDETTKEWYAVLVKQYRPAVDAVCLEAPGGLLEEGREKRSEMARELKEEAGITVKPEDIELVGSHHLASSFCDQVVHLGITKLTVNNAAHEIKKQNGLMSEQEFTEVEIVPIKKILDQENLVTYTLAKYQVHDLARRLNYFA
ncbi:MAG: hypothetical protein COU08_02405 [Candidatus Harrisonbacteria bacterium CG10_big_fil_rev_8_21_14_0_10_42_17]|uniref:Nudix hydrolase domain-containing protein n=1 Tax=Candidatus Harrisonbacteria bacterium CG10_big_fil_rev_8_21_14_0_10_42_17 TaxID=1974584 RepID=A0A2M6WI18_9BACT|nr:MAG: hypothetical protein COU08_02405 [Candidatus Harrisonbacteria bacterium CG10_big_fil_rev_8_21_14_0_10_42_17]